MLKMREQTPLTEGRSSGGMSEKPSRLYGAKICSSSSMSAGRPSTVAWSDASSPAPCDRAKGWLSHLLRTESERVGAVERGRLGPGLGSWPGKVYVKMEPGAWRLRPVPTPSYSFAP